MKKLIASLLFITLISLVVSSCKKSAEEPVDETPMLMNKNWKITAITVNPVYFGITDMYASMRACQQDNLFKFMANGVFNLDEGATKCSASDPQTQVGTWTYNSTTKKLTFNTTDQGEMNVTEVSSTTLKGTDTEVTGGVTYTYNITFTAQ